MLNMQLTAGQTRYLCTSDTMYNTESLLMNILKNLGDQMQHIDHYKIM